MQEYVYVVGGYDSHSQLKSVERFNTISKRWEFVSQMKSPRSALSVAVVGDRLYALGKCNNCDLLIFSTNWIVSYSMFHTYYLRVEKLISHNKIYWMELDSI